MSVEDWARAEAERRPRIPFDGMTNAERAFYVRGMHDGAVARDEYLADRMLSDEAVLMAFDTLEDHGHYVPNADLRAAIEAALAVATGDTHAPDVGVTG